MRWILGAVLALATPAFAGVQDFTVTNKTGFVIDQLYVSESTKADWEEDVLGVDTLPSGKSTSIAFSGYGDDVCKFDIKIVDTDENEWIVEKIDLCKTNKVTFKKEGKAVVYIQE